MGYPLIEYLHYPHFLPILSGYETVPDEFFGIVYCS